MQEGTFLKPPSAGVTHPRESPMELSTECKRISEMLSRVGDKWSVLTVSALGNGKLRFSELRRRMGSISQKMLTSTLRNLERDGFISRTVHPTSPPTVEYQLTELGCSLLKPVSGLAQWTVANAERIETARQAYDKRNGGR